MPISRERVLSVLQSIRDPKLNADIVAGNVAQDIRLDGDDVYLKIDLAPLVGASLEVMDRDARHMRGVRPFVFANLKAGEGIDRIVDFLTMQGGLRPSLVAGNADGKAADRPSRTADR